MDNSMKKYTCSRCGYTMSEPKSTCPSCGVYLYLEPEPAQQTVKQKEQDMKQIWLWAGIIGIIIGIVGLGSLGSENGSFVLCLPLGILLLVGALRTNQ